MTTRQEVYAAIDSERAYQDSKWGGRDHDEKETIGDFLTYLACYVRRAQAAYTDVSPEAGLEYIRKIAGLGVVCMEVHGAPRREGY